MTSIIIYYGYTYFGLPDIDEKKGDVFIHMGNWMIQIGR